MFNPEREELLNVHQVLADAPTAEDPPAVETVTQTFRLPKELKEMTDRICRQNGKDASKFYRQCAETLCRDYLPTK